LVRLRRREAFSALVGLLLAGCGARSSPTPAGVVATGVGGEIAPPAPTPLPPVPVEARGYVPILCYHRVREWEDDDDEESRPYIIQPTLLARHLRYLRDEGYVSVTAAQIHAYYAFGTPLPPKPVMLSFDDSYGNQFTTAVPILRNYGFGATFFLATYFLDRPGFMTTAQIVQLDREGFDIQLHTWNHEDVTTYASEQDWEDQVVAPRRDLETLLGHPTPFFAYPFGSYDATAAHLLSVHHYLAAFRLQYAAEGPIDPLFAIERRIANPYWPDEQFIAALRGE
jgi:peptidoglycan/xylan/chitin deacetylase (PgdA/CDA1 family)